MKVVCVAVSNARDVHRALMNAGFPEQDQLRYSKPEEAYEGVRDESVRLLVIDLQGSDKDYALIQYVREKYPRCTILSFVNEDRQQRIGPVARKAGSHDFQVKDWHQSWPGFMHNWFRSWYKTLEK